MDILFLHQNFPGQYKHLAPALARRGHRVVALGDEANVGAERRVAGLNLCAYKSPSGATPQTHHYVRPFEAHVRRGQQVVRRCLKLRESGFNPSLVCVHPGWGEALFLRDVFPDAKQLHYAEYYYHARGSDVDFDPEFPASLDDTFRVRVKGASLLFSAQDADALISPTRWQGQQIPQDFQHKLTVRHDGIDTDAVRPDPDAALTIHGGTRPLTRDDEVVTYIARNLEPYRGTHTFFRALPRLQALRPNAHILVIGGESVSYGRSPQGAGTYKDLYLNEVREQLDLDRIHFLGKLAYADYRRALQISRAHVYLTYPFVLSWSALEAMAAGCAIVGSDTAPVREVISHDETGLLVDFFDPAGIADTIDALLADPERAARLGRRAREKVIAEFDLKRVCLPDHIALAERVAKMRASAERSMLDRGASDP